MQDRIEVVSRAIIIEYEIAQGPAIQSPVLVQHALSETPDNRIKRRLARLHQYACEHVCIRHYGTQMLEAAANLGFPGGDPAGDRDDKA